MKKNFFLFAVTFASLVACSDGINASPDTVDDFGTGENILKDTRDGQTYKTVVIGTQTWMAENLNYAYTGVPYKHTATPKYNKDYSSDSSSWCLYNDPANCTKYGRLYTWAAAMDSVGTWSSNGKGCGIGKKCTPTYPVRGICPSGWHLPTRDEFITLLDAVGGYLTAGKMLKSTSGWKEIEGENGNGTDAYSFAALPAGQMNFLGEWEFDLEYLDNAYFWSSTDAHLVYTNNFDNSYSQAIYMSMYSNEDEATVYPCYKGYGFSVRCVKD